MPTRLCLGCGRYTKSGSYCAACARKREAEKVRRAPWLALYKEPGWQATKWAVHERDGFRCTFADGRGRCTATSRATRLEGHHVRKLRDLWQDAGRRWEPFLVLALDRGNVVTLCYRHHIAVEKPGRDLPARFSPRPYPVVK